MNFEVYLSFPDSGISELINRFRIPEFRSLLIVFRFCTNKIHACFDVFSVCCKCMHIFWGLFSFLALHILNTLRFFIVMIKQKIWQHYLFLLLFGFGLDKQIYKYIYIHILLLNKRNCKGKMKGGVQDETWESQ